MNGTQKFWVLLILLAAGPLIVVGVSALHRRFPSGLPVQKRWRFFAPLSFFYLASAVFFFVEGANARGLASVVSGTAVAAYALDQRQKGAGMSRSESYKRGLAGKIGARSGFSLTLPSQEEKDSYEQGKIDRARIEAEKKARIEADKQGRE